VNEGHHLLVLSKRGVGKLMQDLKDSLSLFKCAEAKLSDNKRMDDDGAFYPGARLQRSGAAVVFAIPRNLPLIQQLKWGNPLAAG